MTNIAGQESRRSKWGWTARFVIKALEGLAVKCSTTVVCDSKYLSWYVKDEYNIDGKFIPYGGDQYSLKSSIQKPSVKVPLPVLQGTYYFGIARCQQDNNIHLLTQAFEGLDETLVVMSNWSGLYGERLKERYKNSSNVILLDATYDLEYLQKIRAGAKAYLHGHSAGGTNPALVEAMHLGSYIIAFNNGFNNSTLHNLGGYWNTTDELREQIARLENMSSNEINAIKSQILQIARSHYTWEKVVRSYIDEFSEN